MKPEICKECGDAYDPIEIVDGTCWKCMQEEDPLRGIDFDEIYAEVDRELEA